jgi:hypothetical protein
MPVDADRQDGVAVLSAATWHRWTLPGGNGERGHMDRHSTWQRFVAVVAGFGVLVTGMATAGSAAQPAPSLRQEVVVNETLSYEVLETWASGLRVAVIDRSGREASGGFPNMNPAPSVLERRYPMVINWPTEGGRPRGPRPLLINGGYRRGLEFEQCNAGSSQYITICVGFFFADNTVGPNFADAVNMPGDVSSALDVFMSDPKKFGRVNPEHVLYTGYSLGGVVGLYLAQRTLRDPRITALSVGGALLPIWLPEFQEPSSWKGSPPILMMHGTEDDVITYEIATRTYTAVKASTRIKLLSLVGANHINGGSWCTAAGGYQSSWHAWKLGVQAKPSTSQRRAVNASGCARFGVVPGGTTGYGVADPFVPDKFR